MQKVTNLIYSFKKFGYLIKQLVVRDFKVKYKRSVLGVAWSLLNPILMMSVLAIVFSNVFRMTVPGVNFLVYLLIGLTFFNYFSEATNLSMSSIVANFGLLNKVYIPKYIFPLTKCLFVGINFLMTLIPLYAVILITGTGVNWYHLLLPYDFICLFMFTLGMGFLLSAVSVFFRDMFYLYGIITTMWMYLTPLFYDLSMLNNPFFEFILKLNPLYQFINFARYIVLYGNCPTKAMFAGCFVSATVVLYLGAYVFKKTQDSFVYYI